MAWAIFILLFATGELVVRSSRDADDDLGALTQLHEENITESSESKLSRAIDNSGLDNRELGSDQDGQTALVRPAGKGSGSNEAVEHEQAKATLQEYLDENQQFQADAGNFDKGMAEEMAGILAEEAHVAHEDDTRPKGKDPNDEDKKFAKLEQMTKIILAWFNKLKALKQKRDAVRAKKEAALHAAVKLGLATSTSGEEAKKVDGPDKASGLLETREAQEKEEKRKKLASVLFSSAIELARMQTAASDVMTGLSDYEQWKHRPHRQHDSAESQEEETRVKAKLKDAMKFLKDRERAADLSSKQISTLMESA